MLSILLMAAVTPHTTSPLAARSSLDAGGTSSDTLHASADAGEPLVLLLPEASYAIRCAPALSWLVQRSFMWNTVPADTGRHEILLGRTGTPDTLVLIITVQ
jgi:hypothetical protein